MSGFFRSLLSPSATKVAEGPQHHPSVTLKGCWLDLGKQQIVRQKGSHQLCSIEQDRTDCAAFAERNERSTNVYHISMLPQPFGLSFGDQNARSLTGLQMRWGLRAQRFFFVRCHCPPGTYLVSNYCNPAAVAHVNLVISQRMRVVITMLYWHPLRCRRLVSSRGLPAFTKLDTAEKHASDV